MRELSASISSQTREMNNNAKGNRGKQIMKKKSKKLPVILIILAVLGIGSFAGYQILFNNMDPAEQAVIDEEVGSITDEILEDIKAGEAAAGEAEQNPTTVDPNEETPGTESEEGNEPISEKEQILSLYESGFLKLQTEGNAIIDRLVAGIKTDYETLLANGASKTEYARLAASYTNRANAYEGGMDSSVQDLLAHMSTDLEKAGVPKSEIDAAVKEYQQAYEEQKSIRQNKILDKAKTFL